MSGARLAGRVFLPAAAAACLALSCGGPPTPREVGLEGAVMGTTWRVRVAHPPPGVSPRALADGVRATFDRVDARMSTWKADSEVSRFNAAQRTAWFPLSGETASVLAAAQRTSARTDGAFDVTAGPLVDAWGFGSRPVSGVPGPEALARARARTGWRRLEVRADPPAARKARPDLSLDLSALAKGHAVDRAVGWLQARGCAHVLVELGGEIAARGRAPGGGPWIVGIERPAQGPRIVHRRLRLQDRASATSGDYRRYRTVGGRRLSHVVDPRTGRPVPHGLSSVTVVARNATTADAWATALMVLGPEDGLAAARREGFEALLLRWEAGRLAETMTPGFPGLLVEVPPPAGGAQAGAPVWAAPAAAFLALVLLAVALGLGRRARVRSCGAACEGSCLHRVLARDLRPRTGGCTHGRTHEDP